MNLYNNIDVADNHNNYNNIAYYEHNHHNCSNNAYDKTAHNELQHISLYMNKLDNRHSNNYKLTQKQRDAVVSLKKKDRWRSGRNIRDHLRLPIHRRTINSIFQVEGLARENNKRIKAIQRFEAASPNDLWQTDIMGKIQFRNLGVLYLIH